MKEDSKIAISEVNGMEKTDRRSVLEYRTIGLIAGFLLFLAMILMVVFTLQSLNGLTELKEEIQFLKLKVQNLEGKVDKINETVDAKIARSCCDATALLDNDGDYKPVYEDYNTDYEEYYDNDEYDSFDTDNTNKDKTTTTSYIVLGENFTKDAIDSRQRIERSIKGYGEGEVTANSQRHSRKKSSSRKNTYTSNDVTTQPALIRGKLDETLSTLDESKRFRILNPADKSNAFRKLLQLKAKDSLNSAEELGVEFSVVDNSELPSKQHERSIEIDETAFRTGRIKPLPSAHFSGDTSGLIKGQHEHFIGNGLLRHPQRKFVNWIERNWVSTLGMDQHYTLDDGVLKIKEAGLYFIYAQIYYLDDHDLNGFTIYKNNNEAEPLLQCTTMTHSVARVTKGNTCFTAGVEYLEENNRITLADISDQRYSVFTPEKSFFGVIKLGDVKIK